MPEIYLCVQNLAYGYKLFSINDDLTKDLKDLEFKFEMNMEQSRIKLFGC